MSYSLSSIIASLLVLWLAIYFYLTEIPSANEALSDERDKLYPRVRPATTGIITLGNITIHTDLLPLFPTDINN